MNIVTLRTVPLSDRFMRNSVVCEITVAAGTELRRIGPEHVFGVMRMRIMATGAFITHRRMDVPLAHRFHFLGVTLQAHLRRIFQQLVGKC